MVFESTLQTALPGPARWGILLPPDLLTFLASHSPQKIDNRLDITGVHAFYWCGNNTKREQRDGSKRPRLWSSIPAMLPMQH